MKKLVAIGGFLFLVVAGGMGAYLWASRPSPVMQPISFNHKIHIEQDMTCVDCHRQAEKGAHSTFPSVKQCMLCHGEAQGKDPEEPKVREYAESGKPIPWEQVNRLPGHVYFSHAAHTKFAKMECDACHGDMKQRTEPVGFSQIDNLTMTQCMSCHQEKGAENDCLTCHK